MGRKDILNVRQDGDTKKIGFRMIRRTLGNLLILIG